ncbi:MAG: hypothetical protein ACLFWF_12725 [Alphaproteobacteria bacterium]
MRHFSSRLGRTVLVCVGLGMAQTAQAGTAAAAGTGYEPMKRFEPVAGKTWRAKQQNEKGETVTDISRWEYILGGKALQVTHSLNAGAYGGRMILFYDEGAEEYVFYYFTTGGFHTQGTASFEGNVMTSVEKVSGHENIVEVRATATLTPDKLTSSSVYVKKDGSTEPGHEFTYKPAPDAEVVFRPAE